MKIVKPDAKGIKLAVAYLKAGKSVVFPTDTAYGLAADATNHSAVKRIFKIKDRRLSKPVHIVVSGISMAEKYAACGLVEKKLFNKFLPGRLTIICGLTDRAKSRNSWKALSAGTDTIGIRMPKHKVALSLVKMLKRPITATSANVSYSPTAYSVHALKRQFKNRQFRPDLIIDSGKLVKVLPSTMVKLIGNKIKIIRRGPITKKQILNAI